MTNPTPTLEQLVEHVRQLNGVVMALFGTKTVEWYHLARDRGLAHPEALEQTQTLARSLLRSLPEEDQVLFLTRMTQELEALQAQTPGHTPVPLN